MAAHTSTIVVVTAKTTSDASKIPASDFPPDPNSTLSTVNTVAREITEAGGAALALPVDVRFPEQIEHLIYTVIKQLGRIDVLVYNSGAIWWSAVETTPFKRFRLMQQINPEGLYAAISTALPQFERQGWKGRIIVVSPPIYSRFFRGKTAYAIGKVGMSVLTKGLAMDFERQGRKDMAVTSIWPASVSQYSFELHPPTCQSSPRQSIESAATGETLKRDPSAINDLRKAVSSLPDPFATTHVT
jgi:NAD(P)-dependent dehydrogenase (short-subunit alcohol dehydrogenase family)